MSVTPKEAKENPSKDRTSASVMDACNTPCSKAVPETRAKRLETARSLLGILSRAMTVEEAKEDRSEDI